MGNGTKLERRRGLSRLAPLLLGNAVLAVALLGCRRDPEPARATVASSAAPGSTAAPTESGSARDAASAGLASIADTEVHLPRELRAGENLPLLVMLHGLGGSGDDIARGSDWPQFAEQHRIAWIAPSGPQDRRGRRFWNAGASCCNFDHLPVDHVAELRGVIERALASAPIDKQRVFLGGFSNGGFMAHRFGCEAPDLVRGIVSISGSGPLEPVTCRAAKSLRVLQIQGDADPIVPYDGGHLFRDPGLPEHASAQKTVRDWAVRLGCDNTPKSEGGFDFEARLPGAETRVSRFEGCKSGQVQLWTVGGGAHILGFSAPGPESIWRFLAE
jgi:polyhydroxybutyrate depolymerase